jgi:hypothetical protein
MFTRTFWRSHKDDQIVEFVLGGMNGETCALDMASNHREATLDEIAFAVGQTRENIRQAIDGVVYSDKRCGILGWKPGAIHRGGAVRHARILCIAIGVEAADVRDPVYINAPGTSHTPNREPNKKIRRIE